MCHLCHYCYGQQVWIAITQHSTTQLEPNTKKKSMGRTCACEEEDTCIHAGKQNSDTQRQCDMVQVRRRERASLRPREGMWARRRDSLLKGATSTMLWYDDMRRRIHACHVRRRIHACHIRRRMPQPQYFGTTVVSCCKRISVSSSVKEPSRSLREASQTLT